MPMRTGPGEPPVESWRPSSIAALAASLVAGGEVDSAPRVVAIAGRSGAGKSTLTGRLAAAVPGSVVVETDDLAWHEPMFDWAAAAAEQVLAPFRAGRPVSYRPPAWVERDRPGTIDVPAGTRVLLFEGVGASRRELSELIDVALWVQSDVGVAERRGIARDIEQGVNGDEAESIRFWHWWIDQENDFYVADRPWERADLIVAGNRDEPDAPDQVLVAGSAG